jgi:hypothetical protein
LWQIENPAQLSQGEALQRQTAADGLAFFICSSENHRLKAAFTDDETSFR